MKKSNQMATGSDHEVLEYDIQIDQSELVDNPVLISQAYNTQKADWEKFEKIFQTDKNQIDISLKSLFYSPTEAEMDQAADLVSKLLSNAADLTIPKRKPSNRSKSWWNDDITSLRKEMVLKKRNFKRNRINLNLEEFRRARNRYFGNIRKAKADS